MSTPSPSQNPTHPAKAPVHLLDHPLIQHKLTLLREKDRSSSSFRRLLQEISLLMAYEVTRDMPTQLVEIETPLERCSAPSLAGKPPIFALGRFHQLPTNGRKSP